MQGLDVLGTNGAKTDLAPDNHRSNLPLYLNKSSHDRRYTAAS